jgi:hypothetical protein
VLVGDGLNAIMPARPGELFRAEFFKKTFGLARVWGLTSIVIERLFNGIMGFSDTLVHLCAAGLSTLSPSGLAFLGTLQYAYALAVEFARQPWGAWHRGGNSCTALPAPPLALIAAGILVHGSGTELYTILARRQSDDGRTGQ